MEPDNVEWGRITAGLFDIHMTRSCLPALARVFPDAASFLCTSELPVRHSPAPEASAWITGVALMDRLPVPSLLPWLLTERSALGTHAQASRQGSDHVAPFRLFTQRTAAKAAPVRGTGQRTLRRRLSMFSKARFRLRRQPATLQLKLGAPLHAT